MPATSPKRLVIFPGLMPTSSFTSSKPNTSTFTGRFSILVSVLPDEMMTSSILSSSDLYNRTFTSVFSNGNKYLIDLVWYPMIENSIETVPSGKLFSVVFPVESDMFPLLVPETTTDTPSSFSLVVASEIVIFILFCAKAIVDNDRNNMSRDNNFITGNGV